MLQPCAAACAECYSAVVAAPGSHGSGLGCTAAQGGGRSQSLQGVMLSGWRAAQIVHGGLVPPLMREAMRRANEERPGSVHLELPEDVAREQARPFPPHQPRTLLPGAGAGMLDFPPATVRAACTGPCRPSPLPGGVCPIPRALRL